MDYSISEIADIINSGTKPVTDRRVSSLLTDSRALTHPAGSLFFALTTATNDGHRYIDELYQRGVRNFVVSYLPAKNYDDANFLLVKDVVRALHILACHHRRQFDIPVVGITGSRGKTMVKEWLFHLLQADFTITRSPRSYNSQIGVPLSVWEMDGSTGLAIFEAGISRPGEMRLLEKIIRPTVAVLTNIGDAHDIGFRSRRLKCEEKVALMRDCDCIVYNIDDPLVASVVADACLSARELAWSRRDARQPLFISSIDRHEGHTAISYSYLGIDNTMTIPFTDDADIENAIHCLAIMLYLNRTPQTISLRMANLPRIDTRLEVIDAVNNCQMVHDGYTGDLLSLAPALDFMHRRATRPRSMTVILSDILHDGDDSYDVYGRAADQLRSHSVARVIGIGHEISANATMFNGFETKFFDTTESFLKEMEPSDFHNEFILVKGSSGFAMERICDMLEARQHETVLEVNLDAMTRNYNFFRSKIKPSTGIICMVKAFGYGAGSFELAKTLQSQGASYLAVAAHDEGVDLRENGITMPIMVLNPRVVNYKALFAYRLEPEIYSIGMLQQIIDEARKWGVRNYPVHIKLDTGMHRLGFVEEEIERVASILSGQDYVMPSSVFSHLCAADDPMDDEYTCGQFEYFDRCCDRLQRHFSHHILRHILNSTGIIRFPEYQCDMVRLGIGLYGIKTMDDGSMDGLERVSALTSVIIAIREWPAGTTVGYNRKGVLTRPSRIATVPIGYADGLDRHLGCGRLKVMVNGHRCPTVGKICMDVMMIDVTDIPECEVGDRVEIFGNNVTADELAETLGTIPYEVLTSVSTRVKRIYYRE